MPLFASRMPKYAVCRGGAVTILNAPKTSGSGNSGRFWRYGAGRGTRPKQLVAALLLSSIGRPARSAGKGV